MVNSPMKAIKKGKTSLQSPGQILKKLVDTFFYCVGGSGGPSAVLSSKIYNYDGLKQENIILQ